MKRHKMNKHESKHKFSKHADRTHKKNLYGGSMTMRGGIRL